jgi:deazaflavin-dependent oxidoreductase (nitroreductase family)
MDKHQVSTGLAKYIVNPFTRRVAGHVPFWALLETTGRKSGKPRQTPVGNGLDGDTFWLVAEHGRRANYVRNIMADPHVRILVNGRWRNGVATLLPNDDAVARQRRLRRFNAQFVKIMGTDLMTVRIDLTPIDLAQ